MDNISLAGDGAGKGRRREEDGGEEEGLVQHFWRGVGVFDFSAMWVATAGLPLLNVEDLYPPYATCPDFSLAFLMLFFSSRPIYRVSTSPIFSPNPASPSCKEAPHIQQAWRLTSEHHGRHY